METVLGRTLFSKMEEVCRHSFLQYGSLDESRADIVVLRAGRVNLEDTSFSTLHRLLFAWMEEAEHELKYYMTVAAVPSCVSEGVSNSKHGR